MVTHSSLLSYLKEYWIRQSVERIAYTVSVLLLVIPVWIADFPPFGDIPQHAAQVSEFLRYLEGNPSPSFTINLFTPYIFGYVLTALFALVLPLVVAIKLTLSVAIVGFPIACCWLRRESGGKPYWDWMILPTAYSFSLEWGFLNFIIGAPIAIFLIAASLNRDRAASLRNEFAVFSLSLLLFLSHIILYAFFWGIAFLILATRFENFTILYKRLRPLLLSAVLVPIWLAMISSGEAKMIQGVFWGLEPGRFFELLVLPHLWPLDAVHVSVSLLLLAFPWFTGGRMIWRRAHSLSAVAFLVGFMFLPNGAYGASLVFQRFAVFLIPFWLLLFVPRKGDAVALSQGQKILTAIMVILVCIFSCSLVYRRAENYMGLSKDFSDFRVVISQMRPHAKVLSLPFDHGGEQFPGRIFAHFASWYQAFNGGTTDPSFGTLYHMLARYRLEQLPPVRLGFEDAASSFDWARHRGDEYDYFLVHSFSDRNMTEFSKSACPIELVKHVGGWWLYAPVGTHDKRCSIKRHPHKNFMFSNVMRSKDYPTSDKEFDMMHLNPVAPLDNMNQYQWKKIDGYRLFELDIDLAADRGNTDYKTTYVYAEMDAGPSAVDVELELGSDDGLTVWHEGHRIVYAPNQLRAAKWGDNTVTVLLQPGVNHFLFRINNAAGGWRLLGRAVAAANQ